MAPTQLRELVCLSTCIVTFPIYMSDSSHSLVGVREGKNPYPRMTIVTLKMFTVHMNIPVLDVLQPGHGVHMIYAN